MKKSERGFYSSSLVRLGYPFKDSRPYKVCSCFAFYHHLFFIRFVSYVYDTCILNEATKHGLQEQGSQGQAGLL